MVVKEEQERVRALLADTITLLCRNGLTYKSEFNISALIGITLDKEDVLLVDIRETIKNNIEEENAAESSAESEEESPPSKRQRKRRKRKRSQNSNEEISLADKQFEPVNLKTELSEQDEDDIVFIKDEPGDSLDSSMDNSHHYKGQLQQQSFMSHYGNMSGTIAMPGTVNMSWDQSSQQQQQQQQNQSLLANASASNISTAAQNLAIGREMNDAGMSPQMNPVNNMAPRRRYTVQYKLDVLKWHRDNGSVMKHTSERFAIDRKRIREWRDSEHELIAKLNGQDIEKPTLAQKPSFWELESELMHWLELEIAAQRFVDDDAMKLKAKEISRQKGLPEFRATDGWLSSLRKRNQTRLDSLRETQFNANIDLQT